MRSRNAVALLILFIIFVPFFIKPAHAQTQYAYPGEPYSSTNYGATPTYQNHYPATTSSVYPMQQYPAASASAYPSTQYQSSQVSPQTYQPAAGDLQQLPSYQYNQQLDPRYQPSYRPPNTTNAQPAPDNPSANYGHPYMGLETRSGIDLTGQFSYYRYTEPSLGITEESSDPLLGLSARGTVAFGGGYYVSAEGRYSFVDIDYTGSGEINDRSVTSWEWRGLAGKDLLFQQYSLTPYLGFGYRTLFNDNRGISSDGSIGYRRYNQLYYLPIGIQPRTHIDSDARLTSTFEFDAVLHGLQKSDLSDVGLGDPNIKNVQSSGYGLRGDIMYETRTWSIGPYFVYWNIDDSKTKLAQDNSATSCGNAGFSAPCTLVGVEPANHTIEAGVQFRYHFF